MGLKWQTVPLGGVTGVPATIARCRTVEDAVSTIIGGRKSGLQVSVWGGGHNFVKDGVIINLSKTTASMRERWTCVIDVGPIHPSLRLGRCKGRRTLVRD